MSEPTPLEIDYRHQIAQLTKERDEEELNRIGCEYAMTELRRCCGLDTSKIDLREVALHIDALRTRAEAAEAKCYSFSIDIQKQDETIYRQSAKLAELNNAINESWNAFDNGKRKHHTDLLNGGCILGCQACAVEKLKHALSDQCGEGWLSPERVKKLVEAGDELENHYPLDSCCSEGKLAAKKAWRAAKQALEACKI